MTQAVRQEVLLKDDQLKKAQQAGKVVKLEGVLLRTTAALEVGPWHLCLLHC